MNYGFYVVGVDIDQLSVGRGVCDKFYCVARASEPRFTEEILQICKAHEIDAILPSLEEEAKRLKENEDKFIEIGVKILSPSLKTIEICEDKLNTHNFLKSIGIIVPDIYDSNTRSEDVKFPVVVKPRIGRGGKGINIATCFVELRHFNNKPEDYIVQRYAKGMEYTIDILSDLDGNPISIVPRMRIQVESGISMKGITVYDEDIIGYCKKIATELKLVGGSCIQCINTGNREYKFTDINLRFGGGALLALKADPTMLPNLERIIKGEKPIVSNEFQIGLTMLRYYSEIYT
jgi:carbamoyl-phosphate synthase large subunit